MFPLHTLGGRQLLEVQTCAVPRSTMNLIETVTSSVVMTIARGPVGAVAARSKVRAALCGVAFLSATFETPVDGLIAICDAVTRDRSKKPDELSVKLAEVPVLTDFGMTGCGSAGEISNVRNKVAASATKNRRVAWLVMMHHSQVERVAANRTAIGGFVEAGRHLIRNKQT